MDNRRDGARADHGTLSFGLSGLHALHAPLPFGETGGDPDIAVFLDGRTQPGAQRDTLQANLRPAPSDRPRSVGFARSTGRGESVAHPNAFPSTGAPFRVRTGRNE